MSRAHHSMVDSTTSIALDMLFADVTGRATVFAVGMVVNFGDHDAGYSAIGFDVPELAVFRVDLRSVCVGVFERLSRRRAFSTQGNEAAQSASDTGTGRGTSVVVTR